ncbi:hypothetical protein HU200_051348 [Digitaria exilis]|uniref:Rab3GAP catalytic subunit conserved domain-containing protein n=1 Tax=Digitaria exilis TaxID=1010633 RepID=A0A835AT87_9POAL|nr:hypothetical protein HU200_051348 [Digitaria exilis]
MQPPPPPAPAAASTSSAPAPQSLVSRARTAIHSAAARVLTDIKADLREEQFPLDGSQCNPELHHSRSLSKDLHGAPPGSFIHHLAVVIGSISSVHKMAFFWQSVVLELRKLWSDWQPVPQMPLDAAPDLNSCLLHQEIQVVNCCIARKKRRKAAKDSLDYLLKQARINNSEPRFPNGKSPESEMYARDSTGDYVLRLGADRSSENLTLLETGEPIYSPTLQEGPIMTAELIKETEELVLRTGSLGAGCSQLLSDMQAFKAANPGCVLEDFVRWHSPPDWSEDCAANSTTVGEGSSRRGRLSDRMQTKEGNLWKELWEAAKPIPAVEQTPIHDEDLAVESIFDALEVIEPSKLFQQLLAVILSVCFVTAESVLTVDSNLSKIFYDCKDYIIGIYQDDLSKDKLDEICKVYETMEAIITHPEDALQIMEQPDEKSIDNKNRFKLKLNFMAKDRPPLWKRAPKDEKKMSTKDDKNTTEEKNMKILSNLFDKKVNIFSKKNVKSPEVPPAAPPSASLGPFDDKPRFSNGKSPDREMYARDSTGDYVLRLGADRSSENLTLLETGEPIYSPTLQEGPIMTAELIKETEELVLRTGRYAGFQEGNLWKELWETAKPIPAVEQTPIYDEDLAVESIFDALEVIEPSKLFQQVYETMEAIVTHPEDALQIMEQPDERSIDNKNRFKLKLNFMAKDRPPLWKRAPEDEKKMSPKDDKNTSEEKNMKVLSNLFDKKVNLFSRKSVKSPEVPPAAPPSLRWGRLMTVSGRFCS